MPAAAQVVSICRLYGALQNFRHRGGPKLTLANAPGAWSRAGEKFTRRRAVEAVHGL
jgi:hypothetical protein